MDVVSYCYYEKVRITIRTAILSYYYFFSVAELNNVEREDEFFALEFSYEESYFWDSDDEDI